MLPDLLENLEHVQYRISKFDELFKAQQESALEKKGTVVWCGVYVLHTGRMCGGSLCVRDTRLQKTAHSWRGIAATANHLPVRNFPDKTRIFLLETTMLC